MGWQAAQSSLLPDEPIAKLGIAGNTVSLFRLK
jgi:hypothetical protein